MAKDKEPEEGRDEKGRFTEGNTFAEGLTNSGRPPEYKDAEQFRKRAEDYIATTKMKTTGAYKPTVTGLAYHLGFESLQSFYDYEKKAEFSYTVRRLRLFIQSCYEQNLYGFAWAGAFAALKNIGRKDWTDESTQIQIQEKVNADFGKSISTPSEPTENT